MAIAPRFNYFDGTGTTVNLVVSTNTPAIYLTGVLDSNTVDVQISVNGAGFVSDPTLVGINLPTFTIPNLNSYPAGLMLDNGLNTIEIRAIDISGSVSPTTTAAITLTTDVELGFIYGPPTGVTIDRYSNSININWSDVNLPGVTGYNVYASTQPGGLGSGYLRLNAQMIPSTSPLTTSYTEFDPKSVVYEFSETDINDKDLSVRISTVNSANGLEIERKTENIFTLLTSPKYRVNVNFTRLEQVRSYTFKHLRDSDISAGILNSDTFALFPPTVPIYYVVTAVFISNDTNIMNESRYSIELVGSPLATDVNVRGIRIRDQSQVTQNYINTLQKVAPELSLIPGSTVREVHIEPFSNEIQKAYFLMDFIHRAKSFPALLAIDDPNRTGLSIAVSDSQYKQNLRTALSSPDDGSVQSLIDNAFDSLAKNFGIQRRGRSLAVVEQTFYTTTKPTRDLYINPNTIVRSSSDTNAPKFISKGQSVLPAATASRYYNSEKRRYEIRVQMIADSFGVSGNVPAGTLNTVASGATGFSTTNESAAFSGTDQQSNSGLADDASRTLVSLDTGTSGGYEKVTSSVPGVLNYLVVRSGDPYMMRDYDPVRQKHAGGKVDIYVKGIIARSINETYAFKFNIARNIRFDVLDPVNLIFRAKDSRLTVDNPIEEMLYNPSQSLGLYNFSNSPTTAYDLTGVTYLDYKTIQLNSLIIQPSTLLDDFVEGDYRYRSNNNFVPSIQPVNSVTSVVGELSGALDPAAGFTLYKLQDPLLDGESTIAKNYIEIHQVDNVPSGTSIIVNDEQHVLIGQLAETLMSVGINTYTLKVYSSDRTIIYNGPDQVDPDYLIIQGTQSTPIKIVRTIQSNIPNGVAVSVDYEHDENFVVTYNVNDVLQRVQVEVNKFKHITADVIVKQAVANPLDIISTVQLKPKYEQSTVDNRIRTSYSNLIESKNVGDSIHISDVTASIDNSSGVDFVVQPFAKMTLQDGAMRVRDGVANEYVFISSLSFGTNAVYILTEELKYNTTDGGGSDNVHHGVYKDDLIMNMATTLNATGSVVNNSYIIGRTGAIITGYSDDATLAPIYITPDSIQAARLKLTANRVLVSLDYGQTPPDDPSMHTFSATYIVNSDSGSKDIETSQVEYLTVGNLTLTFRKA